MSLNLKTKQKNRSHRYLIFFLERFVVAPSNPPVNIDSNKDKRKLNQIKRNFVRYSY